MRKKLYIRRVNTVSRFTVWLVNGRRIRDDLDQDFTNFGHHYRFKFIPSDEFWIDREQVPGEEYFYTHHMLVETRLMAEGMSYEAAMEKAGLAESGERRKIDLVERGIRFRRRSESLSLVRKRLLKTYSRDVKVWIVNGHAVRSFLFVDFTMGGHDKVYSFIPRGEVWLDDDVSPRERKFVLLHELHERYLMSDGMRYQEAHQESNRIEQHCRRQPADLDHHLWESIRHNRGR